MENRLTICAPLKTGKLFAHPPLKSENFLRPPSKWLKIQATPKLFVPPPFSMAKTFSAPLFVGVKLHMPPPPASPVL